VSVLAPACVHLVVPYCEEEECYVEGCGLPATHRVEESARFNHLGYVAYLCCGHFGYIMGKLARLYCEGGWGE
jgi:hypothetical protein